MLLMGLMGCIIGLKLGHGARMLVGRTACKGAGHFTACPPCSGAAPWSSIRGEANHGQWSLASSWRTTSV